MPAVHPSAGYIFSESRFMRIETTALPGVMVLTPARHEDVRGFFSECWNRQTLAEAGIDVDFVQDNQSLSARAGTVRGLHCQAPPRTQVKLVRCGRGALLDISVDIRRGSPTFGKWVSVELSAENGRQLLVPHGFLHGFVTLCDDTEIIYKCSDYYSPDCDRVVAWNDPDLGVDWGIGAEAVILSAKDRAAPRLTQFDNPFRWEGMLPWETRT